MFACKTCGREFHKAATAQAGSASKLTPGQLGHYCPGTQPQAKATLPDNTPAIAQMLNKLVGEAIATAFAQIGQPVAAEKPLNTAAAKAIAKRQKKASGG